MDLACACDVRFPLPVEEKALSGLSQKALGVLGGSARDGLFTLPVEEKAISGLSLKAQGVGQTRDVRMRWPFHLFTLPVEEKAIMGFGTRLRCPFPLACRGKGSFRALLEGPENLWREPWEVPGPKSFKT